MHGLVTSPDSMKGTTAMLTAIPLVQSTEYSRNEARCKGDAWPCIICGRPIKDNTTAKQLRIGNGGTSVVDTNSDSDDPADMGFFPIGADCLRKHREYQPYAS
jgi:hypothetical protein